MPDRPIEDEEIIEATTGRDLLLQLRAYTQLSQAEMAERASIAQATLSRVERGHRDPAVETMRKIAEGCGFHLVLRAQRNAHEPVGARFRRPHTKIGPDADWPAKPAPGGVSHVETPPAVDETPPEALAEAELDEPSTIPDVMHDAVIERAVRIATAVDASVALDDEEVQWDD